MKSLVLCYLAIFLFSPVIDGTANIRTTVDEYSKLKFKLNQTEELQKPWGKFLETSLLSPNTPHELLNIGLASLNNIVHAATNTKGQDDASNKIQALQKQSNQYIERVIGLSTSRCNSKTIVRRQEW